MKKTYKNILFDLDGTLLDTVEDLHISVNYTLSKHSFPTVTYDQVRKYLGNGVKKLLERAFPKGEYAKNPDPYLTDFIRKLEHDNGANTAPYIGIMELLNKLKSRGYKIAIVSNKYNEGVQQLNNQFFGDTFDFAIGPHDDIRPKPYPDMINAAVSHLGGSVLDTVLIGDTEVDYQTALDAKIDFIAVTWGFRESSLFNDLKVDKIASNTQQVWDFITQK